MSEQVGSETLNDDLLFHASARQNAARLYPSFYPILNDEDLRNLFEPMNDRANKAKRRSLASGVAAVLLVTLGLTITFGQSVYDSDAIASFGAVMALAGGALGVLGVISGPARRQWLSERMLVERLRQFHFQTFVCRTNEILAFLKGGIERDHFLHQRKQWLTEFKSRFFSHPEAELSALVQREQGSGVWLHPAPTVPGDDVLKQLPNEFFDAYRALRIVRQRQHAEWRMRYGQMILSRVDLRSFEAFLGYGSVVASLALIGTEILIVALHLVPSTQRSYVLLLHWFAVFCGIAALGMRTLEEGLQPKREIERYESYGSNIQDVLERFDRGTRVDKFEAMIELELLSFREMRDFLRSADESRFII